MGIHVFIRETQVLRALTQYFVTFLVLRTSVSPQQENGGAGLQPNKRTHKKLRLTSDEVERMSLQDAPRETSDKNKRSKIKEVLVVNKKNIRKQSKENFDEIEAEIASGDEYGE